MKTAIGFAKANPLIPDSPTWWAGVNRLWEEEHFNPAGKTILLAVSGGSDSVGMLEFFRRLIAPTLHCKLLAIHVNHGLRATGILDQQCVEKLCYERNIPLTIATLDPTTRLPGQSQEMWGRDQRYALFAAAKKRNQADYVMTAHQRDDVVETTCLRLWRGTGLGGLASIPFQRWDGVIRPLLSVSREDIRLWLQSLGVLWSEDESNFDQSIPRNWVRHHLLPNWRKTESHVEERLFHLSRQVCQLLPAWEKWLALEFPEQEVRDRGGIPLSWILENGSAAEVLRRHLPILGINQPIPELLAEIQRQTLLSPDKVKVRVNETLVLLGKKGILGLVHEKTQRVN